MPVVVDGYAMPAGQDRLTIRNNVVDDGYWAAMRTPVVRGRPFDGRDTASSPAVAVVNETMARRYWPQQDAIGKTLRLRDRSGPVLQVVGIARDGKYGEIAETPQRTASAVRPALPPDDDDGRWFIQPRLLRRFVEVQALRRTSRLISGRSTTFIRRAQWSRRG